MKNPVARCIWHSAVVFALVALTCVTAGPVQGLGALTWMPQKPAEKSIDDKTKLFVDEGLDTIKAKCLECHSSRLILQNRGNKEHWRGMLRWMEETQGLEPLGELEPVVLGYLVRNYGVEEKRQRRLPLDKELLPPP